MLKKPWGEYIQQREVCIIGDAAAYYATVGNDTQLCGTTG
jgi:hypothetical protein